MAAILRAFLLHVYGPNDSKQSFRPRAQGTSSLWQSGATMVVVAAVVLLPVKYISIVFKKTKKKKTKKIPEAQDATCLKPLLLLLPFSGG